MRDEKIDLASPSYTPDLLLKKVARMLGVVSDKQLSLMLECDQALISRVRKRKDAVSAFLMVRIMDRTGLNIQSVRKLAGMPFDNDGWIVVAQESIPRRRPVLTDAFADQLREQLTDAQNQLKQIIRTIPRQRRERKKLEPML